MENNQMNGGSAPMMQQSLPNATGVLVLGIISIVLCWCYGIGIVLGIIALVLSSKAKTLYQENPNTYSIGSFKNMNAGRICAIIGLSLSSVYLVFIIIYFVILGAAFGGLTTFPWEYLNETY